MYVRVVFEDDEGEVDSADFVIPFELEGDALERLVISEFYDRFPEYDYISFEEIDTNVWPMSRSSCVNA